MASRRPMTHRPSTPPLIALFFSGAALVMPARADAQDSGFLRGLGHLDVALSWSLDTYDKFWIGDREVSNDDLGFGRINRHALSLYAAYGVTNDIDVALTAAFVSSAAKSPDQPTETAL